MDTVFDFVQEIVKGFQAGHMPDLGTWNYLLVAGFIMLQGRVSALLSGAMAAAGSMNFGLIILVALVARAFVDVFWYRIGATGYIDRIGRRFGPYERVANRVQEGIRSQPVRFVVLAKLSNGLSVPAVIAAGSAGLPMRRWLPFSFAIEILFTVPLLLAGYFATDALVGIEGGLSYFFGALGVFILLSIAYYTLKSRRSQQGASA
ncbi:MAG: DedA family protein [Candidatus Promineifilaceae bacterium]|jgi:membrane protein DedA with SNARE-associated domain